MDYRKFSRIDIQTTAKERFLVYWRLSDYFEDGKRNMKQVIQYTTGMRILPLTFDVILGFIQVEKGKRLQLVVEERWPLSVQESIFISEGEIKNLEFKS
ncbi:MAG: hypothetical protein IJH39_02580 [Clostridia bacterium]|nr:hypothetical protein [Clostridia bacterium]